jgi:hypothetical protein
LIQVFIKDDVLVDTNMPGQCVLTDSIPLNSNGKVDTKRLASGAVTGKRFSVKPVKVDGNIQDILLIQATEGELATMGAGIPEELEGDPYTILSEVFAAIPDIQKGKYSKIFRIPGLRELVIKLTDFDIGNVPASMRTMTPKMLGLAFRKYITPMMKGEKKKMSNNTKDLNGILPMFQGGKLPMPQMPPMPDLSAMAAMPPVPPMPFAPFPNLWGQAGKQNSSNDGDNRKDNIKSTMKTAWMQNIDMQKSSVDNNKEQWKQFFDYMMEMQDTFAAALPEETASMPFGFSPKGVMKRLKEFQELSNKHFVEQTDSFADFCIKGQQQFYDIVSTAMDKSGSSEEGQDASGKENA